MRPIPRRRRLTVLLAAAALAAAGCGGDDDDQTTEAAPPAASTTTEAETSGTEAARTESESETEAETQESSPEEEQEGGAGDEEAARSEAVFTGRSGRVTPRTVRVPPFIAVKVVLRSADGGRYKVEFNGAGIGTAGSGSTSTNLDGLRPGDAYDGTATPGGKLRIEASAEPGP